MFYWFWLVPLSYTRYKRFPYSAICFLFVLNKIYINAPFDPPSLSRSTLVPSERSSQLFDSLGNRAIVSACPTLVRFRGLHEATNYVNTNEGDRLKD